MSSAEIQLLIQKVDTISQENALIKLKLEQMDEHKDLRKDYEQQKTELSKERALNETLKTELEGYKKKEQETKLISANSAKTGTSFEDKVEESVKMMFENYKRTSSLANSGDFIGDILDDGYMMDAKSYAGATIKTDDITKLAKNAKDNNMKAAILVYKELPGKYGDIVDFKYHNQENAPTEFDKEMFFACTLESFPKTLMIAVSRSKTFKQIPQYDAEMLLRMSNLFKQAMQFHLPLFSAFSKDDFSKFCKQFATDGHSLLKYCSYQNPNDENEELIKVKKMIKDELSPLFPTRRVGRGFSAENLFGPYPPQKRKLECDNEDVSHKKAKVDEKTGETQIES